MKPRTLLFILLISFTTPAYAQQMISSGTGFFISKAGHIITNEHVVRGCDVVKIRNSDMGWTQAQVIKTDSEIDLALLKTSAIPRRVAPIRAQSKYTPIRKGDRLLVIGYPENHGQTGKYKMNHSRVIDVKDPMGGDSYVLFEDAARHGNSGGPLLDESGNVIGVVMAKTQYYKVNLLNGQREQILETDLAISLPYLWEFIENEGIYTVTLSSALQHGYGYLERMAAEYIVNIHCVQ